jgi:ACS family hexuronate transporter-like MFS transporter
MINYIDRQTIALLKPMLETEFGWSDLDYAHIVSSFQLATVASIFAAGLFVDRLGVRAGYAAGVSAWSAIAMAHAWATSIPAFMGLRAALGATEAVNLPAAVKTVATWFDGRERSLALGIMNTAPNIGAIATPLMAPIIAVTLGWQAAFLVTGALGFVWLGFWLMLPKPAGEAQRAALAANGKVSVDWPAFLRDRRLWAIALSKLMTDLVWNFMLFWAPDLFHKRYGLSTAELALPVALVFAMAAAGSLFGGGLSSTLLHRNASYDAARKTPMLIAAVLAYCAPLSLLAPGPWAGALLIGATVAAHQIYATNVFALATDLFPARMVGIAIGFGATFGSFSGLAMLELTGFVLDATGSYAPMLFICGGAYTCALTVVHLLVPNVDRMRRAET